MEKPIYSHIVGVNRGYSTEIYRTERAITWHSFGTMCNQLKTIFHDVLKELYEAISRSNDNNEGLYLCQRILLPLANFVSPEGDGL